MSLKDRFQTTTSSSPLINLINFALRLLQAVLAAAVIGIYASEYHTWDSSDGSGYYYDIRSTFYLATAVGVLSLLTALIFAILPFILSYRLICFLAPWDWILFFIWTATFAEMKKHFPWGSVALDLAKGDKKEFPDFAKLQDAVWVDLTSMLLWLITGILGLVMLFVGGRFGGRKGANASYV